MRTASRSPKRSVEVTASHAIGGPNGRGRSPTTAFSGAVKTLTPSSGAMPLAPAAVVHRHGARRPGPLADARRAGGSGLGPWGRNPDGRPGTGWRLRGRVGSEG